MTIRVLNIFLYLTFSITVLGQSSFLPVNLGPAVNSTYAETNPVLSPDGKTLYFVRANHPENYFGADDSQDIWVSTQNEDGTWAEAKRLEKPFNTARYNAVVAVADSGNRIYINGIFDNKLRWKKRGISVITKTGPEEYSNPVPVKVKKLSKKNKGRFGQVFVSEEENIMLLSFSKRWNGKKNNLYVSFRKKNDKWKKPKKIKKPVKSRKTELAPTLSNDASKLFFTSNRKNGKGEYDIYVAQNPDDKLKKWSEPVLLSDTINTGKWDGYLTFNKTESWGYFVSNSSGEGSTDIFKVKLFEENPFVIVSGVVINETTQKPIEASKNVTFLINDTVVDSVTVDSSGTYSVQLPLGNKYVLNTSVNHYISRPDSIDVSKNKEFFEAKRNLYVTPLPYVLIEGKVKLKDGADSVKINDPVILVNGKTVDFVKVGDDGTFSFKLNHGKTYILEVEAKDFNKEKAKLDLRDINEYQIIEKDLYVSKIPEPEVKEAIMTGKIVNTKTMKGIDSTVFAEILINDYPSINSTIKDSIYTLKLPLGDEYEIVAKAENFYPVVERMDLKNENEVVKIFKDLYITPLEVGSSVKLENIFFETGKATLKEESYAELDRVVRFLDDYPTIKIEISGHTDNVGSPEFNKTLSDKRAKAVATYLEDQGISNERLTAIGYGMEKPVASNDTEEGRQQNRRVEFTILEK